MKVLVVDDEKWIRKGIVSKLKGLADEVEFTGEAQSGREALTLFDNCPADLVITDIKMPDMDGLELIKDIKSRGLDTKFIIISGYAEFDFAKKAIELSVKKYLLKPIMEEDIVNAVKSIMNEVKQNNAIQKKVNDIALNRDKLLIEKILNKIIHSEIDDLEFENMMDYFPYLRNTYVMLICFEINSKDKKAAQSFMDLIIEQTYKYGEVPVFNNYYNSIQVLSLCYNNDPIILKRKAAAFSRGVTAVQCDREIPATVGISIADNNIKHLSRLYRETQHAIWNRFAFGSGKIFFYEDYYSKNKQEIPPITKFNVLNSYLRDGNISLCQRIINEAFEFTYTRNEEGMSCILFYKEVLNILKNYVLEYGSNPNKLIIPPYYSSPEYLSALSCKDELKSNLLLLLNDINKYYNSNMNNITDIIEDAYSCIMEKYGEDLKLNTVARKYSINPTYFSEMFKKIKGVNYSSFLISIRVEKARELLKNTSMKIKDISKYIGYTDQMYFSRIFKKVTGVTPEQYRSV